MAAFHFEAFVNSNREKKSSKPFKVPRPWDENKADEVSTDERERLRADLLKRSAFSR